MKTKVFVYPYKLKGDNFCIEHSIRMVRKYYSDAEIVTIGDRCGFEDVNIPFKDSFKDRGSNVTAKCLQSAFVYDSFIYMNDDFFINDRYDLNITHGSLHDLERKDRASANWNTATTNTMHWLKYNGHTIRSFECHQPVVFDSKRLIDLMSQIEWKENPHFIKSLYFNVHVPIRFQPIDNTKLIKFDKKRASSLLSIHGCLSIGGDFLNVSGADYIKKLT